MSNGTKSIQCDLCGASNSSDSRFCQKCGAPIVAKVRKCRRCGALSELDAAFCRGCGANLDEAKLGVTAARASEWWSFLGGYEFFRGIWSANKGVAAAIHVQCKAFRDDKFSDIQWERAAVAIPITASDWCIKLLEWKQHKITHGEILGSTTDLIIFDLSNKKGWRIPYTEIQTTRFEPWVMQIALVDGSTIKLIIKETGSGPAKFMRVVDFFAVLSNPDMGVPDRWSEVNAKRETGAHFWNSINSFFEEVLSHK